MWLKVELDPSHGGVAPATAANGGRSARSSSSALSRARSAASTGAGWSSASGVSYGIVVWHAAFDAADGGVAMISLIG